MKYQTDNILQAIGFIGLSILLIKCTNKIFKENKWQQRILCLCTAYFSIYQSQNKIDIVSFLFGSISLQLFLLSLLKPVNRINCLIFTNVFLFLLSVSPVLSLHQELFIQFSIFIKLIGICFGGLILIMAFDKCILKYYGFNVIMRRKIFHFIPAGVIIILERVQFQQQKQQKRYIGIMLVGGFYVTLMLQLLRYFINQVKSLQTNQTKSMTKTINKQFLVYLQLIVSPIYKWMQNFNDGRQNDLWLTHLFLYLGIIVGHFFSQNLMINVACVMMVSDAMAAYFGRKYGKFKVNFKIYNYIVKNNKTFQGATAFAISTFILLMISSNHIATFALSFKFLILALICSICELFSGNMDNLIPTVGYIMANSILNRLVWFKTF